MKAVGTTVNKNNIGSTLRRNGLKSCSSCKVPPLKKLQACLKFPVNIKMIQKSVGRKCCWKIKPKSSSLASTVFGGREMLSMT